jgi:hypothetical protein
MENMFGMIRGKYFGEPPLYVDKKLPAGMTDLPSYLSKVNISKKKLCFF